MSSEKSLKTYCIELYLTMNLTMIYIGIWTYIKEEVENVVVESWRRYILYPLHATGLSQHVSPTSMWGSHVVRLAHCIQQEQAIICVGYVQGRTQDFKIGGLEISGKKKKTKQNIPIVLRNFQPRQIHKNHCFLIY